jgi:hypothetical protein
MPLALQLHLDPPGLALGTEVCLGPGSENDLSGFVDIKVGKGEGKGCRSTNNGSTRVILRSNRKVFMKDEIMIAANNKSSFRTYQLT